MSFEAKNNIESNDNTRELLSNLSSKLDISPSSYELLKDNTEPLVNILDKHLA